MSTQPGKDTIYIDVDDEITAIIDKVRGSHEKIVALVLPKRATVLQSIVNMKLLKRTADAAKKHLVLITGEAGLMPLAANVGIYVAKTLQSKPEIPTGDAAAHDPVDDQEDAVSMADDLDTSRPVGEHMRHTPSSVVRPGSNLDDDTIELDNGTPTPAAGAAMVGADAAASAKKKKGGLGKKFKIPDFNKFRTLGTLAAVAVVVLIVMLYFAFSVLPSASISIKTDSTAVQQTLSLRLNTAASTVNVSNGTVPAISQETTKTVTQQGEATGQVDKGTKASGQVIMTAGACTGEVPTGIPAGTGLSANGLTFIVQSDVSFSPFFNKGTGKCVWTSPSVGIIAQNNGDKYNIGPATYSVAGRSDVSASSSSSTSGGTSNIVKIVTQADIDNVKQKIVAQDTATVKKELQQALVGKGLYAIQDSFINKDPEVITNVPANAEASTVTLTQKTTYTMLGAKQDDLKKIIGDAVNKKIDTSKQQILDYGLDDANFQTQAAQGTVTPISMSVTAVAGTDINVASLKQQVAGKKSSEAKDIIGKYPGVTKVDVSYSPFWVSSIPKKTGKISVTIEKPTATKNAN